MKNKATGTRSPQREQRLGAAAVTGGRMQKEEKAGKAESESKFQGKTEKQREERKEKKRNLPTRAKEQKHTKKKGKELGQSQTARVTLRSLESK